VNAAQPDRLATTSSVLDLELRDLEGRYCALSQWRAERLLLVFIQAGCRYSRALLRTLAVIVPAATRKLALVLVGFGDLPENRTLAAEYGVRCPLLVQDNIELAEMLGVEGTPSWCLVADRSERAGPVGQGSAEIFNLLGISPAFDVSGWGSRATAYVDAGHRLWRLQRAREVRLWPADASVSDGPPASLDRGVTLRPLVTVVMTTRDRPRLLGMALDCYRRQTYARRELVVVDDGSRHPADLRVVEAAEGRLLRVPEGTPLGAKLNLGIQEASGSLIQKWDDDDWYAPGFMDALSSAVAELSAGGKPALAYLTQWPWLDLDRWSLFERPKQAQWGGTLLFRRADWQERRFREIRVWEDTWFLVDQIGRGVTPVALNRPGLYLLVRHDGLSGERLHSWRRTHGRDVGEYLRTGAATRADPVTLLPEWAVDGYRRIRRAALVTRSSATRQAEPAVSGRTSPLDQRPNLLYIAPFLPSPTGSGSPMHAATMLRCLARYYRIHLLVIPREEGIAPQVGNDIDAVCEAWAVVPPAYASSLPSFPATDPDEMPLSGLVPAPRAWRRASEETLEDAFAQFEDVRFDVVHTCRLLTAPFAEPYLQRSTTRPVWHLDLNEVESINRWKLANLYRARGDLAEAELNEDEAVRYAAAEAGVLPRCDRVFVVSDVESEALRARHHLSDVVVLPNAVMLPLQPPPTARAEPFTLFFVGTFGYLPNDDAAVYLCSEIVPALRRMARGPFRVILAGSGVISEQVRKAARAPDIELAGYVSDLATWYERSHIVVVPLRAGTGTRIKIVEAMSYGRPVVSTSIGVEGLEVQPGVHILIGDTPDEFASRCAELMRDLGEWERLSRSGRELCERKYSLESLAARLDPARSSPVSR
jgi:glycosyltransferase involved in cell wall biosynthesis